MARKLKQVTKGVAVATALLLASGATASAGDSIDLNDPKTIGALEFAADAGADDGAYEIAADALGIQGPSAKTFVTSQFGPKAPLMTKNYEGMKQCAHNSFSDLAANVDVNRRPELVPGLAEEAAATCKGAYRALRLEKASAKNSAL